MTTANALHRATFRRGCILFSFITVSVLLPASRVVAADATWTNDASSTWAAGTNWDTGTPPGATSGATSTDTATFYATALTASRSITVDSGRNVKNLLFTNSTAGFTFQLTGGSLLLSAGGRIELTSSALANIQTFINSPITLEGSYTFFNNGGSAGGGNNPLEFQGGAAISGAAGLGAITLTLGGTNGNNSGKSLIGGIISNGTGNTLAVVKQDSGIWQFNGANTYTGGLAVKQGSVIVGNNSALGGSGAGAVILGDTAAGQDAQIITGSGITVGNPITIASGLGNRILSHLGGGGNGAYSGTITLNKDVMLRNFSGNSARILTFSGAFAGNGNIIITNGGAGAGNTTILSGTITNNGAISNVSVLGDVNLSGAIGTNVTAVVENSATSALTISGAANTYKAGTLVSSGTLALGATASIASSANITVASGATFDVSAAAAGFTLANGQTLQGSGNVNGNVAAANGSKISPGGDGVADILSFLNNLDLSGGGSLALDVGTSSGGANDWVPVSGVLTASGSLVLHALDGAANLDVSADYILISAGSINGSFSSTPVWSGTPPANAANFSVVTGGSQVTLHYTPSVPPSVTASAAPATAARGQSFKITAVVTPGSSPISAVTVDLSFMGGSSFANLVSSNADVYTNTFTVGPGSALGSTTLAVTATDTGSAQGSCGVPFTVAASLETWNGAGADNNWGTAANWTNGIAPLTGDYVFFDGSIRPGPNLETAYDIAGLTFNSGASAFTLGSANGSTLTLSGGITNNSPATQTLTASLWLSGTNAQPVNAAAGNIVLAGTVIDNGLGFFKTGGSNLTLSAANDYYGPTMVSNGTLTISGSGTLGGGSANLTVAGAGTLDLGGSSQFIGVMNMVGGSAVNGAINAYDYELQGGLVSASLEGSGVVAHKSTTNTLVLAGTNTFDGGFVISNSSAGLCINSATALGTGLLDISQGGNGGSFDCTAGGAISNANNNAMNLSGDFTFVGSQNLNLGTGSANMGTLFAKTITVLSNRLEFAGNIYSGGTMPLTKAGPGTLILSGASTYFGATVVNGGTLLVNGSLDSNGGTVTVETNGTLAGTGVINRPVIVNPGGNLSPGAASIGTITVNSNLTLSGNLFIKINQALAVSNDLVVVSGALTNAGMGTVTVTNLNAARPLVAGDRFQLFSQPLLNGDRLTIAPAPGSGLAWTNKLAADGTIAVVTGGIASNPTSITATVSGGNLTLTWPADHTGWTLQSQTNSASAGLGTNWVDVAGSTATNSMTLPMVRTNGAVFFRLKY